ncbi:TolB-like 6-bladed beta-propeller domain-containing protein [Polaribacter litorisediminis]|uniref:BF3164 family lipoprotein n=1 Tax=Polaribacter litorisediminis TaxID=1908341 RepID=UPI001CBEDA84|nr:BF3164 family lipoprotein [Polaribacter litorisediminis]UAM98051.1 TolB-like 6-bladed beta-propeller domain-containing protein [Polaribacter litorisediminis]
MKKIIIITCFIFINCKTNIDKEIVKISKDDFPKTEKISGEIILKEDYNRNYSIKVFENILLIRLSDSPNYYSVYNKYTFEYLGSIGVKGEAGNEWITMYDSGQLEKTESGICLWVHRYQKGFFAQVNITKTLATKKPIPIYEKIINIDAKSFPFFNLFYLEDNLNIIGNCWLTDQNQVRIKSYDINTKKIKKSELFPKIKNLEKLPIQVVKSLYSSGFKKHPTKNIFFQAMYMFDRIDIFDENLNLKKSIVGGENWKDNYYDAREINPASNFLEGKVNGYAGISASESYIIAVDVNKKKSNIDNTVKESYIKIFDWEGKPICRLKSTDDLFSISLDEKEGILYATDINNEKVLRYDINKIMEKW